MPVAKKSFRKSKKIKQEIVQPFMPELAVQKFIEKNFNLLNVNQLATAQSLAENSQSIANNYLMNCIKIRKGICVFCNSKQVKFSESKQYKFKCDNCKNVY